VARYCQDDECGEVIEAGKRADAAYCSNACRQRSYRRSERLLSVENVERIVAGDFGQRHPELAAMMREAAQQRVTAKRPTSRNAPG